MELAVLNSKFKACFLCLALVLSLSYPKSADAGCASCWACVVCVGASVVQAKATSAASFVALHGSISSMGSAFSQSLGQTSTSFINNGFLLAASIRAASSNITTQVGLNTTVETQLYDALNAKEEIRAQQVSMLNQKRNLEEDYNPDTLSRPLQQMYASQTTVSSSEYQDFIGQHREVYSDLLRGKRNALFSTYVVDDTEMSNAQELLWGGEIVTGDEAAQLVFLTQQILFGGDNDPFRDLLDIKSGSPELSRDELELSNKVVWSSRIKPAMDLFALDHAIRSRPSEDLNSVFSWLELNVTDSLYSAEGVMQTYAQASETDLLEALALEQKKRNLIRFLNFQLTQIQTRIESTRLALNMDTEQKVLRYDIARKDKNFTSEE